MKPTFWEGKKVFLTGHTGFQGSWLCLWLQTLGAKVVGYALGPPTQPNLFDLAAVGEGMNSMDGDVRNGDHLNKAIQLSEPDIILHLAAQSLVSLSYQQPAETFSSNVLGTVHLLQAFRQSLTSRVLICVTSDKCYLNEGQGIPFKETDPLGGKDPYACSKAGAEWAIRAYTESYSKEFSDAGKALASVRVGNVIGGGDWAPGRLIPDILRALAEDRPVLLRQPESTRPWQYVLEPLHGYLILTERLWENGMEFSGPWNMGPPPEEVLPVSEVTDKLIHLWGSGRGWSLDETDKLPEDSFLLLDSTRAKQSLGWSTKLSLEEALGWVVDWEKKYRESRAARSVSLEQIFEYQKRNMR